MDGRELHLHSRPSTQSEMQPCYPFFFFVSLKAPFLLILSNCILLVHEKVQKYHQGACVVLSKVVQDVYHSICNAITIVVEQ